MFWGMLPHKNDTDSVSQTFKHIFGLHSFLDYPLNGAFSQIIALCVAVHWTYKNSNHSGKAQRK